MRRAVGTNTSVKIGQQGVDFHILELSVIIARHAIKLMTKLKHLFLPCMPSDVKQDSKEQFKTPGYQFSVTILNSIKVQVL